MFAIVYKTPTFVYSLKHAMVNMFALKPCRACFIRKSVPEDLGPTTYLRALLETALKPTTYWAYFRLT